jgi:hypothetical protein
VSLSSPWARLRRYVSLGMLPGSFWDRRADFYRTLALSQDRHELLRDFIEGELSITLRPQTRDASLAAGLKYIRDLMDAGDFTLVDLLKVTMPHDDHMAIGALGNSKKPIEALRALASNVEEQQALSRTVRNAILWPLVLLPVGFAFSWILTTQSLPIFIKTAPPEIWVGANAVFRSVAQAFAAWAPLGFGLLALACLWFFVWGLPSMTGLWRYRAERATGWERAGWTLLFPGQPLLRLYRDVQGTRMLTNLAFILQSGELLKTALEIMAQHAKPWMRQHIVRILDHLAQIDGDYVGAFSHGVLSPYLSGRIQSLVRLDVSRQFDKVLVEVGTKGVAEAREAVRKTARNISVALMAGLLGLVLYFYGGQTYLVMAIKEASSPTATLKRAAQAQQSLQ